MLPHHNPPSKETGAGTWTQEPNKAEVMAQGCLLSCPLGLLSLFDFANGTSGEKQRLVLHFDILFSK